MEKAALQEKHSVDYGSGIGIDIGYNALRFKTLKRRKTKRTRCKCGSMTHVTARHRDCPLNRANIKKKEAIVALEASNNAHNASGVDRNVGIV